MRINLPTWLTLFRVALLPVMVLVFYLPFHGHNITAAIVFALAGITDWLDGYLARRLDMTSKFALREWMAEIGMRATVQVAFIGKLKTVMQMVALIVLILQHEKDAEALRLYHIGEGLLVLAGVLTIWSGLHYLRAAWPALHDDHLSSAASTSEQDRNA